MLTQEQFADGWARLTMSQGAFVTEQLTQTYWEVLQQLHLPQWVHSVRMALEDPEPPKPGQIWPTGKLLAWGRSYLDPSFNRLAEPRSTLIRDGDPELPRGQAEDVVAYVDRLARHLGYTTRVMEMPDQRMPYREPGEDDGE